jgi:hypothetical protein
MDFKKPVSERVNGLLGVYHPDIERRLMRV